MKLSLGPISIHAFTTGKVIQNENGSMDIHIQSREGSLTGTLFLTSGDVEDIMSRRLRKVETNNREEGVQRAFGRDQRHRTS